MGHKGVEDRPGDSGEHTARMSELQKIQKKRKKTKNKKRELGGGRDTHTKQRHNTDNTAYTIGVFSETARHKSKRKRGFRFTPKAPEFGGWIEQRQKQTGQRPGPGPERERPERERPEPTCSVWS
jgi:hypothetical protein